MKQPTRWARSLSVASLSLVTLFGCASIIGLDDYTVAGQGGSAGQGAHAGKAGSTGSDAGETGEGGDLGQAGDTAQAGASSGGTAGKAGSSSGEGGEGGQVIELPPIVGCDGKTTFQPNNQIVTSCLIRAGCSPYTTPLRNISTCVTYDTQQALPGETCTRSATTCAEYEECEHVGIAGDDLCGGSKVTRCQGNIAVNCDNYAINQFTDCDALGGTCATYDYNGTIYADCKQDVSPDTNCVGETDDSKHFCHSSPGKDDLRYYCWEGEAYGQSCSSLAYCDGDQTIGDSSCYYNLPTCSGSSVTCKSNVANVCSDGSLLKYDCGSVGLTCGVTLGKDYCFAPGCKAADVDDNCTESCSTDGNKLNFCYGGAPFTVDCADYGFTHCESGEDDDGIPFAACRP
ncbi:MAG: hypothetical protein ABUL62_28245 [Myxococcales bacterium]|jgi:hypothetical protein